MLRAWKCKTNIACFVFEKHSTVLNEIGEEHQHKLAGITISLFLRYLKCFENVSDWKLNNLIAYSSVKYAYAYYILTLYVCLFPFRSLRIMVWLTMPLALRYGIYIHITDYHKYILYIYTCLQRDVQRHHSDVWLIHQTVRNSSPQWNLDSSEKSTFVLVLWSYQCPHTISKTA